MKNLYALTALMFLLLCSVAGRAQTQRDWINKDTILSADGDYSDIGWPQGVKVIVPAGVTITNFGSDNPPGFGGGQLIVYGNLTMQTAFQIGDSLIVGKNAQLTCNGDLTVNNALLADTGSTILINGNYQTHSKNNFLQNATVTVEGTVTYNGGGLYVGDAATLNAGDLILSNARNYIKGIVNLSNSTGGTGTLTLNSNIPPDTLDCPAQINVVNLQNNAGPNVLIGSGYIVISGTFSGSNPLTNSESIVVNSAGGSGNLGDATPGTESLCSDRLPINLSEFVAQVQAMSVKLDWTTVSEINNTGFSVEHSANGKDYTQIAFINTKAVNGNSSVPLNYSYTDNAPVQGNNFYRLKQIDVNGITAYYTLRNPVNLSSVGINIYPSPVTNTLNVLGVRDGATFKIFDISGKVILTSTVNKIDVSELSAGIYFVQITENGKVEKTEKFIKR